MMKSITYPAIIKLLLFKAIYVLDKHLLHINSRP